MPRTSLLAAVAALAALCACAAPLPASAGIHTFSVDLLHRAMETHDGPMSAEVYAEQAELVVNGQTYSGRPAIERYFASLSEMLVLQRYVVTSPVYETGNLVHYFRQGFLVGKLGCLSSVRSFEQVVFDEHGSILRHSSDWHESPATVQDDLDCRHGEHGGEGGHEEALQENVETVYAFHHALETGNLEDLTTKLSPHVAMTLDGNRDAAFEGPEVAAWFEPVFEQLKTAVFTPVSAVQSRGHLSVVVSALFFMTNTGCSGTAEVVIYMSHDDEHRVASMDLFAVGSTMATLREHLLEDCGLGGPAHDEL